MVKMSKRVTFQEVYTLALNTIRKSPFEMATKRLARRAKNTNKFTFFQALQDYCHSTIMWGHDFQYTKDEEEMWIQKNEKNCKCILKPFFCPEPHTKPSRP